MESMRKKERKRGKKKRGLYIIFIRYLLSFCAFGVLLVAGLLLLYTLLVNMGIIRLPTYEQSRIEAVSEDIRTGEGNEEDLLPDTCAFGVYDAKGRFLYGSFGKSERDEIWNRIQDGRTGEFYNYFYRTIQKEDGSTAVVRYQMVAKFSSPLLRKLFPNAEFILLGILAVLFLAGLILFARSFGRYLKKRLDILSEIAEKVGREDLNFEREHSDIREVDEVLSSIYLMKEALQKSLKDQWESRRQKEEQAAALAHDIKTPLTIIRGNAELMQETCSMEEVRELDQEILDNAAEMERYLAVMRETLMTKGKRGQETEKEERTTGEFLKELRERTESLARIREINTEFSAPAKERMIQGTKGSFEELMRALGNIVSNGADYSPAGGTLSISGEIISGIDDERNEEAEKQLEEQEWLRITVTDSGPGFPEEALRHGTEQFYQADQSRSRNGHYGMGLYIARTLLEKNGGKIWLGNTGKEGGGRVQVYIPVR